MIKYECDMLYYARIIKKISRLNRGSGKVEVPLLRK